MYDLGRVHGSRPLLGGSVRLWLAPLPFIGEASGLGTPELIVSTQWVCYLGDPVQKSLMPLIAPLIADSLELFRPLLLGAFRR